VRLNRINEVYSALGLSVDGAGSSSPTYYTRTNAGQLVSERTTAGTYYYLMDDLGSVLKVVDSSGSVKNSYYYDPYGNSLNKSETVSNSWQYAGGYLGATTGLYKFGTRYYDPQLGRWTQKDPIGGSVGKIGSGNPYVYVNNVPNMATDPSGRDVWDCILAWVIVVGLGATLVSLIGALLFADPPLTGALLFFAWLGVGGAVAAYLAGVIITIKANYCS